MPVIAPARPVRQLGCLWVRPWALRAGLATGVLLSGKFYGYFRFSLRADAHLTFKNAGSA